MGCTMEHENLIDCENILLGYMLSGARKLLTVANETTTQ